MVMKRLNLLGAIALVAVGMTVSYVADAQEDNNRDELGRIIRGPYLTNRFGDNWFVGVGGGINTFLNDGYKPAIGPSIDANFGKWFTPAVGMRIGYQGISSKVWADQPTVLGRDKDAEQMMYAQKFGYMYIHGDFLWNFSDAVSGYKQTRFWDLVPYLHAGYYRSYGLKDVQFADNEIAGGVGLLHNMRLVDRLDIIIDMRATVVNGRAHAADGVAIIPSITAGLAVNLGLPGFARAATVVEAIELVNAERVDALQTTIAALEVANHKLAASNKQANQKNAQLQKEMAELKDSLPTQVYTDFFDGLEPAVIFFEIGKTKLGEKELNHLEFIAKSLIAQADQNTKLNVTLMGSADSNTGSMNRNTKLSHERAQYVYDLLTNEYGISPERLVMKSEVVKADSKPEMSRAVIISF